ncbi:hypothetical protein ACFL0M_14970 [Thermodesulfobacteriota bacterium]
MIRMKMKSFNLFENTGSPCNLGSIHGRQAFNILKCKIDVEGENICWNIDFKDSIGTDYYFFCNFLGPIFNNFGEILPNNTVVIVACHKESDLRHIYSGLSFSEKDELSLLTVDEAFNNIQRKNRYFLLIDKSAESVNFKYVGTTETDLLKLLQYLELKGEVSVLNTNLDLKWQIEDTVKNFDILCKRRLIIKYSEKQSSQIGESLYVSPAFLLKETTNEN